MEEFNSGHSKRMKGRVDLFSASYSDTKITSSLNKQSRFSQHRTTSDAFLFINWLLCCTETEDARWRVYSPFHILNQTLCVNFSPQSCKFSTHFFLFPSFSCRYQSLKVKFSVAESVKVTSVSFFFIAMNLRISKKIVHNTLRQLK